MLHIDRVLFPTDFSPAAERAYIHAAHLAAAHRAELHAVHVTPEPRRPARDLLPASWGEVTAELHPPAGRREDGLRPEDVVQTEIEGEAPAAAILRYAGDQGMDLIVIGTHGRGGIERALIGSVAERVVREAPCPVLTVRAPGSMQVRRILVPVDFSDLSKAVIPVAEALAELYGATIELLYVIDEDDMPMQNVPLLGPVHVSPEELKKRLRKLMDELIRSHRNGIELTGTLVVGNPAESVLEHAEKNADLIVMPTHGRTGLKRFLLGSVAEKIVRRAPCPVFTIKSFGRDPLTPA